MTIKEIDMVCRRMVEGSLSYIALKWIIVVQIIMFGELVGLTAIWHIKCYNVGTYVKPKYVIALLYMFSLNMS